LIEVGVTRGWGDFAEDVDEPLQNGYVLSGKRRFAVMMTLATPGKDSRQAPTCEARKAHVQHLRKPFSAVRSGLFWTPILTRRTLRGCDANGCTPADENLKIDDKGEVKGGGASRKRT
jgi:hypothetical protein